MHTARLLACLLSVALLSACASPLPQRKDALFQVAVEASLEQDPALSARASWAWLQQANQDDPRYDRAQRLLALAAERLGLTWAASLWWLDILQARRDVTLLNEAVEHLASLSTHGPWDEHTLLEGLLATGDLSGLQGAPRDFVLYQQGLDSLRRGLTPWALRSFQALPHDSPWAARARHALLVRQIALGELDQAQQGLTQLLQEPALPEDLRHEANRTLARVAFAQQRYEQALEGLLASREQAPRDPSLLLELAWTHYQLGQPRRALGLLLALDAPAHRDFIAPERFLLEALCLQKLCQFEPARYAAIRLRQRHGDALEEITSATPLCESRALQAAARHSVGSRGVARLRARVEHEARLVEEMRDELGAPLADALEQIYGRGQQEMARREQEVLRGDMEALAGQLLRSREGVELILHEISVGLLRGRRRQAASGDQEIAQSGSALVLFRFDGEFWNDELDDLLIQMEDRCIEP